jgi:hypothetical protein
VQKCQPFITPFLLIFMISDTFPTETMGNYKQYTSGYHRRDENWCTPTANLQVAVAQLTDDEYDHSARAQCNSQDEKYEAEQSMNAMQQTHSGNGDLRKELGYHESVMLSDDQLNENQFIDAEIKRLWAKVNSINEYNAQTVQKYHLNEDRIARIEWELRHRGITTNKAGREIAPKRRLGQPWKSRAEKKDYETGVYRPAGSTNNERKIGVPQDEKEIFNDAEAKKTTLGSEEKDPSSEQTRFAAEIQMLKNQVDYNERHIAYRTQRIYMNEERIVNIQRELFHRDRAKAAALEMVFSFQYPRRVSMANAMALQASQALTLYGN